MSSRVKSKPEKSAGPVKSAGADKVMHEQVYSTLREALIAGQLAPGRALSVRRLAAEFEVSTMPAREAIRRLAAVGALDFTDTRRVTVSQMTEAKLREIKEARVALEPVLSGFALERVEALPREKGRLVKSLEKIDKNLDLAIRRGDVMAYSQLNSEFHFTLYRAANANVLLNLVESLWLQFGPFMRVVIGRLGTSCLEDDQHKEIIEAVVEGDSAKLQAAIKADIVHGMQTIELDENAVD